MWAFHSLFRNPTPTFADVLQSWMIEPSRPLLSQVKGSSIYVILTVNRIVGPRTGRSTLSSTLT